MPAVRERRNHIGGALIGAGAACWIAAVIVDTSEKFLNLASVGLWLAGVVCLAGAAVMFRGGHDQPRAPASTPVAGDVALSLQGELEEAADTIGHALERGRWWLPSDAPPRTVWEQRDAQLRTFGERFHKPVRDAYRKVEQHNREAQQREAAEYNAVGGELTGAGRALSDADRGELEVTRGVVAHALDRLSELAARDGDLAAVATLEHRDALRQMLQAAQTAVEGGQPVGDGDHLEREMFAAHFADLDTQLRSWDATVRRDGSAFGQLREAIVGKLRDRQVNHAPYALDGTADGIATIVARRALAGTLGDPLPPAFAEGASVWRAFANDHVMYGMVDFNPYSVNTEQRTLLFEREDYPPGPFPERVAELLGPLYEVLTEAQTWEQAREIPAAREALQAFPRDALVDDLRKAQLRPNLPTAPGCHGCD